MAAKAKGKKKGKTKSKAKSEIIRLNSTADTGHFYTTRINKTTRMAKQKTQTKLVLKKYDPVVRKHVDYKEGKVK